MTREETMAVVESSISGSLALYVRNVTLRRVTPPRPLLMVDRSDRAHGGGRAQRREERRAPSLQGQSPRLSARERDTTNDSSATTIALVPQHNMDSTTGKSTPN